MQKNKIIKPTYFNVSNNKNSIIENNPINNEKTFASLNKMEVVVKSLKTDIRSSNLENNIVNFKNLSSNGKHSK